jgi:beta-lactamase class A
MFLRIVSCVVSAVLVSILISAGGCALATGQTVKKSPASALSASVLAVIKENRGVIEEEAQSPTAPIEPGLTELQGLLEEQFFAQEGVWAIYVKDLSTGADLSINSNRMVSASLIKLFIMAAVFDQIDAGILADSAQIRDLLEQMITVSDNESSNELVTILGDGDFGLGMERVNTYARAHGYLDTEQQRDMKDYRPVPIPEQNYTSVNDCGLLLDRIYQGECVSPGADSDMLDLLLAQTRTGKIPSGLPSEAYSANKTGELMDTENDTAIVFAPWGDYIVCIMGNDLTDTETARQQIVSLSSFLYEQLELNG